MPSKAFFFKSNNSTANKEFPAFCSALTPVTLITSASYFPLSRARSIHSTPTHPLFFQDRFNIIVPSMPTSSNFSLSSGFPTKILMHFSSSTAHMLHLSPIPSYDNRTTEHCRSRRPSLSNFLFPPATSSLLDPHILLITLLSQKNSAYVL